MLSKARKRVYEIIEAAAGDRLGRAFDTFIVTLIAVNVLAVILETVGVLAERYGDFFRILEVVSVVIFSLEYVLRLWTCTINERFGRAVVGRLRFSLTPLVLVDLGAVLPFYLPMLIPLDLRFLRVLRLIRIFRMFKVARYFESLKILGNVFKAKKEELVITGFILGIILVLISSLVYYVENKAQPGAFSSIPQAMWWGIAALSTVGYGDVYPVTSIGKVLGSVAALLGIGMFALPTGILSSGFAEEIRKRRDNDPKTCPHCGRAILSRNGNESSD